MENISEHISWEEATHTSTGLPNVPNEEQIEKMKIVAEFVFEKVRAYVDEPILVDSFFRSPAVNERIGGVNTSQHCKGEAIDIKAPVNAGYITADLFHYIKEKLAFDQLIWEHGTLSNPDWVHVSYSSVHNRNQVLRSTSNGGRTIYIPMT